MLVVPRILPLLIGLPAIFSLLSSTGAIRDLLLPAVRPSYELRAGADNNRMASFAVCFGAVGC